MDYLLVVVTHGEDVEPLRSTLTAFHRHVRPLPTEGVIYCDGEQPVKRASDEAFLRNDWTEWAVASLAPEPRGFCEITRGAWRSASGLAQAEDRVGFGPGDHPHVFWLEHDFEITRDADLVGLAATLDADPLLAQMALMRNAVNEAEKDAGGLYESRFGEYAPDATIVPGDNTAYWPWLRHRSYLTTNPSLMRRDFMATNPWPAYESECEGRFGIDLVGRGYSFGVWGSGEPWCRHAGERNGFGY
jgi:hypothetical protein